MLLPYLYPDKVEAGCDEAGRGCLAGPVVCASVILPPDFRNDMLNDSKQLSEKKRDLLRPIIEREAIAWSVVMVDADEIDRINILQASIVGMQRAASQLAIRPELLLIDGNRFSPHPEGIPHVTIVKGDAKYMSIAAASVLAKTHRDEYMLTLAKECPGYGWEKNKGYPTRDHREAIMRLGKSPYHRLTFKL